MSVLTIDNIWSYDDFDSTVLYILDSSDYSSSTILMSSVYATRFKFATVNSLNSKASGVKDLKMGVEYTVTGTGTIVIDTKTFSVGDTFVLYVDVTVSYATIMSIDETGYFVPVSGFVPSLLPYATFVPSQVGQSSNIIFNDNINDCIYEIYNTTNLAGSVTISTPTQFIVQGAALGTIVISGVTYRVGEVFTKSTTFTFADGIGTNTVCALYGSNQFYFMTDYYANQTYEGYVQAITGDSCDQNLQNNFLAVHTLLNSNIINFEKNINLDIQGMQNNLTQIQTNFSLINKFS